MDSAHVYDAMIGKVFISVTGEAGDDEMVFLTANGEKFRFYHEQSCCEQVDIDDICGDLNDLCGAPIVEAEVYTREDQDLSGNEVGGSCTWTFYKFATTKGSVTVRWFGSSNGWYSERVDCEHIKPTSGGFVREVV